MPGVTGQYVRPWLEKSGVKNELLWSLKNTGIHCAHSYGPLRKSNQLPTVRTYGVQLFFVRAFLPNERFIFPMLRL